VLQPGRTLVPADEDVISSHTADLRTGGGIGVALSRLQQQIALLANGGQFLQRADSLPAGGADLANTKSERER
jgi:hypothetical protein